jgi:transposase-like protein
VIRTDGGPRKQLESDDSDFLREVGAEAYLRGVSPRRVEGLVEALGIASLSKSQVSELAAGL